MTIDFLYPYHFNGHGSKSALKRLITSINSVINQDVNICVVNTSKKCIWKDLKSISNNIRYIHKESKRDFNKPRTVNFGVKNLITSPYFILSDVDLVYSNTYVQNYEKYFHSPIPKRVVPYNYNLKVDFISSDYNKYMQHLTKKDPYRRLFGIAPGNGLIHTKSFYTIRGFNEDLYGYSPEDADFNFRIGYINNYIEDNNIPLRTIHLYHKMNFNSMNRYYNIQFKQMKVNLKVMLKDFDFSNTTDVIRYNDAIKLLQVNKNRDYGILD